MGEQAHKLLIVEDDPGLLSQLRWCFEDYDVYTAGDRESAIAELRRHEPAVVLQDLGLPPKPDGVDEGLLTLAEILKLSPSTKVIVVTGHGDQENALRAVALGAYDFYQKPVDTDTLKLIVERAFSISLLEAENRRLQDVVSDSPLDGIVAASEGMLAVCRMIEKVAPTDVTTLLLGESGTGKELAARAIHESGRNADRPFVVIDCGSLTDTLLESELFGHVAGAFTGATSNKVGKFQQADGGTIFLDEIGDLPLELQAKLLRVLQEGEFERIGNPKTIKVDVRVIAATNRELAKEVEKGNFREDLYYRLNVLPIHIPALRERKEDIPLLVEHFIEKYNEAHGLAVAGISQGALKILIDYSWPGNIRELEHTIEKAVILSDGEIVRQEHLFPRISSTAARRGPDSFNLEENERILIENAMRKERGNVSAAAKKLGINRSTLYQKMKKYGI